MDLLVFTKTQLPLAKTTQTINHLLTNLLFYRIIKTCLTIDQTLYYILCLGERVTIICYALNIRPKIDTCAARQNQTGRGHES